MRAIRSRGAILRSGGAREYHRLHGAGLGSFIGDAAEHPLRRPLVRAVRFVVRHRVPTGVLCAVAAVLLHLGHAAATGTFDLRAEMYRIGQLLTLNVEPDAHGTGPIPIAARMLAAIAVALLGLELAVALGSGAVERLRLWWRRRSTPRTLLRAIPGGSGVHWRRVLVLGTCPEADWFADRLAQLMDEGIHASGVVTHLSTKDAPGPSGRSGVSSLLSVARPTIDRASVREAGVDVADDIVIVEADDAHALGTLALVEAEGGTLRRQAVRVRIRCPELAQSLTQRAQEEWGRRVRIWCPDALSSRRALRGATLDASHSFAQPGGRAALVCIGFGDAGRAFAAECVRQVHHVDESRLRLHLVDPDAERCRARLQAAWPGIDAVADVECRGIDAFHPDVATLLRGLVGEAKTNVVVSISVGSLDENLSIAIHLARQLPADARLPLFVRQSGLSDATKASALADLLLVGRGIELCMWGDLESSHSPDEVLEERLDLAARAVHEAYLEDRRGPTARGSSSDGKDRYEAAADPFSSMRDWDELWSQLQEDCRSAAEFAPRALAAIGVAPSAVPSAQQLETLSRLEHRRWVVNRLMHGWTRGPVKDRARRTHPDLVPFDQLSAEESAKHAALLRAARALAGSDDKTGVVPARRQR